ncbi:TonB-dependent receptor family protein [Bordetella genomosp. 13]|uniref:TonB-dependent siderophore receptor n=1 Tax=Bordetella genomosp. 13 TaxID=463040 RepID=A0A1W6Z8C4_9BORD|nr:TonB-dependent receptor [Bordetella genomosp. 13]ARP93599.1 TonB-dependent siderophore receptor [Bordetella genomosp. 13]
MRPAPALRSKLRTHSSAVAIAACVPAAAVAQQPAAPATLAPVVVTGTRVDTSVLDTPASVDVVDGATLRARRPGINLSEGLASVPGLQIQNRQNYAQDLQISIRGFGARSTFGVRGVRLYVDGIPGTMPDGQGQTSNIDIASIDRVEVLRGPYSALYGNSSGGVIQVFTEDGTRPPSVSADLSVGSDRTIRYGAKANGITGTGIGELDYAISLGRFTTDGYRDHSAARKTLGNMKLGLQLDESSRLTLVANSVNLSAQDPLGLRREQFEDDPRSVDDPALRFDTRKTVRQSQGGLTYERDIGGGNTLRAMVYYGQRHTVQYQSIPVAVQSNPGQAGGVIDLEREYGGADVRWTARRTLAGQPLTLIGGLAYDTMAERRRGYNNYTGTAAAPTLGVRGDLRRDENNDVYNVDPYAQASWQFDPRWTLDAGLRYSTVRFDSDDRYITPENGDDSGDARYRKALPVAALRFAPTPASSVYVSYGRGFETPTLNELSYRPDAQPGLNFALAPSVSTNVEAGAKLQLPTGLLTAAVFQSNTDDEIVPAANIDGRSTFRNAGRTRRNGFELEWRHDFAQHARVQMAYSWLDARYRDSVSDAIRAGNRIPGTARNAFYAALAWQPPEGWQAGVEGRYLNRIYTNDANTEAAPSYFIAAASAGYAWRVAEWRIDAYARVDNLFDREYAGSVIVNESNGRYYEPAPGRSWTAGLGATYTF